MHKEAHHGSRTGQYGSVQLAVIKDGEAIPYSRLTKDEKSQIDSRFQPKLDWKQKGLRIGGLLTIGALIAAVVILATHSNEEEPTSPCQDKDEGIYASGWLEMLNMIVGQTIDFASDATVLLCDAAHKQFSEISEACFRATATSNAISFLGDEHRILKICKDTIEQFLPALHEAKAMASAAGNGTINWHMTAIDSTGGTLATNGSITFQVTEASLRRILTTATEAAITTSDSWASSVAQASANLYQTTSTAVSSAASSAYDWATWALGR